VVDSGLQHGLPPAESALSHWNLDVLSSVQVLAQQQAPVAAADLISEVAKVYDPRIQVGQSTRLFQVANANTWETGLTTRYRHGSSQKGRFGNLLMESRDGFTANRRADLLPGNPLVSLRKRGGTDLVGEYSWRGLDTLGLHVNYFFGSSELTLGWGSAENRRLPMTARSEAGGSWRDNPRTSRLAERGALVQNGYGGTPEFRDIVRPQSQQDLRLTYSVDLKLPRAQMRLADSADAEPGYVGDALHALSSAELYFRRPVGRADARLEYPNLFNPYWQAHLIEVTRSTRAKAAPLRGLKVDPYTVLP
jgi:hypothetical protein